MEPILINLNRPQWEALNSTARETFVIGGVGMGKTFLLGCLSLEAMKVPGSVNFIGAPTINILRKATLPLIQAIWEKRGVIENVHYVVNIQPPSFWGIKRFSSIGNDKVITTIWGSYAIADGLENFNAQRGLELDKIFVDEYRETKMEEARNVLGGRLRGRASWAKGLKPQAFYVTTPPRNPSYLLGLLALKDPEIKFITGKSYDNIANLGDSYIEGLKKQYDDLTYRIEVMGELLHQSNTLFIYTFNKEKHVGHTTPDYGKDLYLSFDFNLSPMTCIAAQHHSNKIQIIKEWCLPSADIYKICDEIRPFMAQFTKRVIVTGDASGNQSSVLAQNHYTAYKIIQDQLNIRNADMWAPKVNATHENSMSICNSIIDRHASFRIDASCINLIEDIQMVRVTEHGKIDKSDLKHTHLLDCLRYYFHTFHESQLIF